MSDPHPHRALITALGGPKKVSKAIRERTGKDEPLPATVAMWNQRGVAHEFRPIVADLLTAQGVAVPEGFLLRAAE